MLEQLSRHSLMDINLRAKGDLHIDAHHTTEDTGIPPGKAFSEAMGDCRSITRYANAIILMDETRTRVSVDISGHAYLVWRVNMPRAKLGKNFRNMPRIRNNFPQLSWNYGGSPVPKIGFLRVSSSGFASESVSKFRRLPPFFRNCYQNIKYT